MRKKTQEPVRAGTRVLCYQADEPGVVVSLDDRYPDEDRRYYKVLLDDGTRVLVAEDNLTVLA